MNAYIDESGREEHAVWIDLNSVQPATPKSVATDIAAFEFTCLWPALLDAESHSPSLFSSLVDIMRSDLDPLTAYGTILAHDRDDYETSSARAQFFECLGDTGLGGGSEVLTATRLQVATAMAPAYFLDQTKSDQNARFFSATLAVERARHQLLEEERTRLHGIRYLEEAAAIQERVEGLERSLAEASEALQRATEEREDVKRDLSRERAQATELSNENARLRNGLNEIYVSRAWRLVSRVRAVLQVRSKVLVRAKQEGSTSDSPEGAPATGFARAAKVWYPPAESFPYLVSVVMPVYNKGTTLRGSIDSVLEQTLPSVEVVVWDDGSDDEETLAVLAEVASLPNVTVFRADNQGVVGARNSGIAMARGRYICCLDPDDEIAPTYLEMAVALLEAQPEYAIAYPWVHSTGDVDERWETQDLDPSLILRANHLPVCAVARREVFFETGGFSPEMEHGYEDWELWVHAAELGFRGKSLPVHLLKYRFSRDADESRDARARERHDQLVEHIAKLHPRLARTGVPFDRGTPTTVRPVGLELGQRRLPMGKGRPIVMFLPWFTVGGADRVVASLASRWVNDGRTVAVFTTKELAPGMSNRMKELELVTPFVYPLPAFLPEPQWYEFATSTIASLGSPVVFSVGSSWFHENAKALRRDFPDLFMVDQQFNALAHLAPNRSIAETLDLTIAAYEGLAAEIAADGRSSRVAPIYVGIDEPTPASSEEIDEFRADVGLRDGESLLLFVGRLADEKRPDWVIRLASDGRLPRGRVVVIGDGPLRDEVADAASSNDRLVWLPSVDQIEPAVSAADLIILPSKIEGIPLIAMEALALGTPIVATRVGGLPDLETEPGVVLTDPEDFDQLVEAIAKTLRADMAEIRLPRRFSSEVMLEQYDLVLFGKERGSDLQPQQ
jgi:glycosyltransferase involved in cell wall biosynthesis/GT2 family glycosyltransferase